MFKRIKNKINNSKGFISIQTIIIASVIFPMLLLVTIDFTYFMQMNRKLKNITDNACASAVTIIDEKILPTGKIHIDEIEAKNVAKTIIIDDLMLNKDLSCSKNSLISNKPKIEIEIINNVKKGMNIKTKKGDVSIQKPSVVIYGEYPINGLIFKNAKLNFKKLAVSQAQFLE